MVLAMFAPHLGETFEVDVGEDRPMPIVLVEATPLAIRTPAEIRKEPFQLKFAGPGPAYLNQMIHRLRHPGLGDLEIFMTPIGRQGDGFLYQAVFN